MLCRRSREKILTLSKLTILLINYPDELPVYRSAAQRIWVDRPTSTSAVFTPLRVITRHFLLWMVYPFLTAILILVARNKVPLGLTLVMPLPTSMRTTLPI